MATIIKIKRTTGTSAPSSLNQGELAYVYDTASSNSGVGQPGRRLFIGDPSSPSNTPIEIGGEYFTNLLDHAHGTVIADSGVIVDSSSKIDNLIVDDLNLDGNTLSSTTGDIVLSSTGDIDADTNIIKNVVDLVNAQDVATKNYVDTQLTGSSLEFAGDTGGTLSIDLDSQTLSILGGTGIETSGATNDLTITLSDTTVTPGSYGSTTAIPTFTVDQQGRLTSAGTATISTTLDIAADSGTANGVDLLVDTLAFTGGTGINTSVSGDTVTFDIDNTVVATLTDSQTLSNKVLTAPDINGGTIDGATINGGSIGATTPVTELQVDDINVNGNEISNTSGAISLNALTNIDVNSSKIVSLGTPTDDTDAATKAYVDTIAAAGIHYNAPVRVESPTNLNATYNNSNGTLTNAGTQTALVIDGITLSAGDRVLVYTQTNQTQNGIYEVTDVGSGASNWELTRTADTDSYGVSDPDALGQGDAFFVKEGDTGAGELYVMNTSGTITFGTTNITFSQIAETAVYSAGQSLTLSGTEFSVTGGSIGSTQLTSAVQLQILDSSGSVVKSLYGSGS